MQQIADFDPGNSATYPVSQTFFLPGNSGMLAILNDSPYTLGFQFNNGTIRTCPGGMCRAWVVDTSMKSFTFAITNAPAAAAQAQVSQCVIEYYYAGEEVAEQFPSALTRLITIGNSVPVSTAATSVQNDGNAAGTQVFEAKAAGLTASATLIDNQGTLQDRVISNGAQVLAVDIEPGGASTPATILFHGTADKAAAIPATGVTAGALPAGVTLDGASITGNDLPVAQLANAGNLPAGITVPGSSIAGAVASATAATLLADGSGAVSSINRTGSAPSFIDSLLAATPGAGNSTFWDLEVWNAGTPAKHRLMNNDGTLPTAQLASGALPAGVTVAASQVGTGYPAADLGAGTVPAGVVLPAANLDGNPLPVAGGKTITGFQQIHWSSSGTYSHAIGVTPDGALCNTDNGSNSSTFGSGSYTSSSVFLYSFSPQASVALIYKAG